MTQFNLHTILTEEFSGNDKKVSSLYFTLLDNQSKLRGKYTLKYFVNDQIVDSRELNDLSFVNQERAELWFKDQDGKFEVGFEFDKSAYTMAKDFFKITLQLLGK